VSVCQLSVSQPHGGQPQPAAGTSERWYDRSRLQLREDVRTGSRRTGATYSGAAAEALPEAQTTTLGAPDRGGARCHQRGASAGGRGRRWHRNWAPLLTTMRAATLASWLLLQLLLLVFCLAAGIASAAAPKEYSETVHGSCNLNGHLLLTSHQPMHVAPSPQQQLLLQHPHPDPDQRCLCLPGWRGATCGELAVLPAVRGAGLHAVNSSNLSSWGASIAWDATSARWQGLFNELVLGCGITSWEANSRIVRASTDDLARPFVVEAVIKPAFGSEPTLTRTAAGPAGPGKWLMYSIGNTSSTLPPRTDCDGGYTPKKPSPNGTGGNFRGFVPVEIASSDSLTSDQWKLEATVGNGDFNPAGIVFLNGSSILMWRHLARVHMVSANSWRGPFAFNGSDGRCLANASHVDAGCRWWHLFPKAVDDRGLEDPVIFTQPSSISGDVHSGDVTYHALFHDHTSFGGHAFSRDGAEWTFSATVPFSNVVNFTDGGSVVLQRRERPHVITDAKGFITHLVSAVQPPPTEAKHPKSSSFSNDYTYTMVVPVAHSYPDVPATT
jgi:hypothetical protein